VSVFRARKYIGSLPATIDPNTLYFIRTGGGFDLYCSDTTGSIAHPLNGGSGSGINDLLALPIAYLDFFEYSIVIQDGELRRMSFADMAAALTPGFVPPPRYESGFFYNTDVLIYDEIGLYYADQGELCFSDEFLYYGEEKVYYSNDAVVPENAIYHDGEPIPDLSGTGYLTYQMVPENALYMSTGLLYFTDGTPLKYGDII
jgi:hypothetical protein